MLADDFKSYRLSAMAVQETHMKNSGIHILTSTSGEVLYLYYSGNKEKSRNGVGIIVNTNTKVSFKPISDRICMLTTNFNDKNQVTIISVYAPTLESTRKSPEETINFYNDLNTVINLVKSRDTLLICGDFNAKAKPKNDVIQEIFMKNIGKYGKGELNENGQYLLEFAKQNDLRLTNTFFKHKPCHRTTWECPNRINEHIDSRSGNIRRNPYRNQIDYILIRNKNSIKLYDSRSYGGMRTTSDQKPVIADIEINWYNIKK